MSFDELMLNDVEALSRRDDGRLLWSLATAGAQVRRAEQLRADFGVGELSDDQPRSLLIAIDGDAAVTRVLERLCVERAPTVCWHGAELPRWAGAADALVVASHDGRNPRLAELAAQAEARGLAVAVVAPPGSPVATAAARGAVHELAPDLHVDVTRWALLTPLLQAVDALGLASAPPTLQAQIADALDETAEMCRPSGDLFTNPAKALAAEFADTFPLLVGAGAYAVVAAEVGAEALQRCAGAAALAIGLPDGVARAGALLRGSPRDLDPDDFFRDRLEGEHSERRARLVIIGDDGDAADDALGARSAAQIQLDEVAARRAASALRSAAEDLGVRSSGVEVPAGPPLARFAAASAFCEFSAAYLALGLGIDPGAPRPAEIR